MFFSITIFGITRRPSRTKTELLGILKLSTYTTAEKETGTISLSKSLKIHTLKTNLETV